SQAQRSAGDTAGAARHAALSEKHKLAAPPLDDPLLTAVNQLNAGAVPLIGEGLRLDRAGQLAESAAVHEKALEIDPQLAQAHINLISLYGRLGRPERAEQHYRSAIALNPNLAEAYYNYGVLRASEEAFRKALDINPNYAEAHGNLGDLVQRRGDLAGARRHFEKAVALKPDYRVARFHLARILIHQGALAPAIAHLEKILAPEDETTPAYLYALGAAHARSGDRDSALRYLRQAREHAARYGQTAVIGSIDRDLRQLERRR
ncbi:MAG: tetratricopeptide repeat protein, partial [Bryobacteraceae bacterium]